MIMTIVPLDEFEVNQPHQYNELLQRLCGFSQVLKYGKIVPLWHDDFATAKGWAIMKEGGGAPEGTAEVDTASEGLWNGKQCLKCTVTAAASKSVELNKRFWKLPSPKVGIAGMLSIGTIINLAQAQFFIEYFPTTVTRTISPVTYWGTTTPKKWTWRDAAIENTILEIDMRSEADQNVYGSAAPKNWVPFLLVVDLAKAYLDEAPEYVCVGVGDTFLDLRGKVGRRYTGETRKANQGWWGITQSTGAGVTAVANSWSDLFGFCIL